MLRRCALIGLLIGLGACASVPQRVSPETLTRIKKVAVMSLVAHEFHRQYVGFTAFGNEYDKHDIVSWKVDDEYEAQMHAALSKMGRFDVVRVPYERAALYGLYDSSGRGDAPAFRTPKWSAIEEKLKTIADSHRIDAIVILVRRESEDVLAGTNQYFRGAGFYTRGTGGSARVSVLHLVALVALIDGQTGAPVATHVLARGEGGWPGPVARAAPMLNVGPELTRTKLNELGEARTALIRSQLVELPREAWEPTFRALFSVGSD